MKQQLYSRVGGAQYLDWLWIIGWKTNYAITTVWETAVKNPVRSCIFVSQVNYHKFFLQIFGHLNWTSFIKEGQNMIVDIRLFLKSWLVSSHLNYFLIFLLAWGQSLCLICWMFWFNFWSPSISLRAVSSFANPAINPNNVSVVSHYDC